MEIINHKTNDVLKRMKSEIFIRLLSSSILYIAIVVLVFIFQSRRYQLLFVILLGLSTSVFIGYFLYVLTQYILKRKSYKKLIDNINKSNRVLNDVIVTSFNHKRIHVMGIEVSVYNVKEIDTKREFMVYIDEFHNDELKVDKQYEIATYHGFLISYEEQE